MELYKWLWIALFMCASVTIIESKFTKTKKWLLVILSFTVAVLIDRYTY